MFNTTSNESFSWAGIVDRNRIALKGIVETLFAMLGLVGAATDVTRLSPAVYLRALRLLRPTESAVRRLIVMAARGLVVKPVLTRPKPAGLVITKGAKSGSAFQLFDTRKSFPELRRKRATRNLPRIRVLDCGYDPRIVAFLPKPRRVVAPPPPPPPSDGLVDGARLIRRLQAVASALNNLPRQATRFARWHAKRENISHLRFRVPMRPGQPPGHRFKKVHEIDDILYDCHHFAWEALKKPDTS